MDNQDFRPYSEEEIPEIMSRMAHHEDFDVLIPYVFPNADVDQVRNMVLSCKTTRDFQINFMARMIKSFIKRTASAFTFSGSEKLDHETSYLFIGNHRDIVLDSGILQVLLMENGLETSEMSIGKNLMVNDLISDLGKANKMIPVERNGSNRELLKSSSVLSNYIRKSITERGISVWIAQRNGRAKNGDDKTEGALLKMLNMSGDGSFISNFSKLNIVPVSVSYEIEPCDVMKVQEVYESAKGKYVKKPGEDVKSMATGLMQQKGRIHMSIGNLINDKLKELDDNRSLNESFNRLSRIIDQEIYRNYKLWPSNYIAYDMLFDSRFEDQYSKEEKRSFVNYFKEKLVKLNGDKNKLADLFLEMYANPVINKLESGIIP